MSAATVPEVPLADEADPSKKFSFMRNLGSFMASPGLLDRSRPMGSWTGLPTAAGAPISGLLHGALLGAAYHGVANKLIPWIRGEEPPRKSQLAKNVMLGSLLGLGVGGLAAYGHYKKQSAIPFEPTGNFGNLIRIVLNDPTLTEMQKQMTLAHLDRLSRTEISMLNAKAAFGGITGAAIAAMLGVNPLLGAITGGLAGASMSRNRFTF